MKNHGMILRCVLAAWIVLCGVFAVPDGLAGARSPEHCRLALALEDAFWNYATPERKGTVTLYVERRDGVWAPTLSADAQRGLNVAHDGYITEASSDKNGELLRVRLHIRRDRWMDIVGEATYDVRFKVEDGKCVGTWRGVIHGRETGGNVGGVVKPVRLVKGFVPPEPGEHPRLLIRKSDLPALRKKAKTAWGKERIRDMKAEKSLGVRAFLYALTGDAQHVEDIKARIMKSADGTGWHCLGGRQHETAFKVAEQLIAYDLIHDKCDEAYRRRIAERVADKLEMYYWGAYNTQFNGHDRSNWSLMFRSAAGIMALSILDYPLEAAETPAREELLHVTPEKNLEIGKDVPIFVPGSKKPISDWLYAGPLDEPYDAEGFKDVGGMAKVRPEAGARIGGVEFRRIAGQEEIKNGAVNLRKLGGGKVNKANYLYCVLDVKEPGCFRFDSMSNPKGVRWRVAYLGGQRMYPKEFVRLDAGRYPLLLRVWTDPMGGWEPHVVWARFVKVEEKEAMAWHMPRATGVKADKLAGENWRDTVAKKTPWNLGVLRYLRQAQHEAEGYFTKGLGEFGWNHEGEAYTRHAIRLGIPFAICYRNTFGLDMDGADRLGMNMALCTASTVFSDEDAKMQSFNVGGGPMDVDLYGSAFTFVPDRLQPAVLWGWNRSLGLAAEGKLKDMHSVIATNAGLTSVLRFINTPLKMKEKNPDKILDRVTVDQQKGGYVFRNDWQDGNDCVVQLFANSNMPGGTWSSNQGGTFRITGLGDYWVVRGQSYGNGASARGLKDPSLYQNMVDVGEHALGGCPQAWTTYSRLGKNGSGVVSLNMDEIYMQMEGRNRKDLGIKAVRSLATDYSGASGAPCLVAVADRLKGTKGDNTWQLALPRELKVAVDGNAFTVTAKTGATLRGTVVLPANAAVSTADYEHVHEINYHGDHGHGKFLRRAVLVKGADADQDFLVVMTLQHGEAPACTIEEGRAKIGKQTVSFDGDKVVLGVLKR